MEERKSRVLETLEKLQSQQRRGFYKEPQVIVKKERSEPIKTLQQQKVKDVMDAIDHLDKKMRSDSKNYLSMYWDMAKLEKKFLSVVEDLRRNNINVPELFDNEIEKRKTKIEEKFNRMSTVQKDKLDNL